MRERPINIYTSSREDAVKEAEYLLQAYKPNMVKVVWDGLLSDGLNHYWVEITLSMPISDYEDAVVTYKEPYNRPTTVADTPEPFATILTKMGYEWISRQGYTGHWVYTFVKKGQ